MKTSKGILTLALATAFALSGALATRSADALFLKKSLKKVGDTAKKVGNTIKKGAEKAKEGVKEAAKDTGNFFKKIASKTGEAFSPNGLKNLKESAVATWKAVKDTAKKGYEGAVAGMKKLVTKALEARLIAKAKESFEKTLGKVSSAFSALKKVLEDKAGRDRVWGLLKRAKARELNKQVRDDVSWLVQKLGFPKKGAKGASRRVARDSAQCGYAAWPKSLCIGVAVAGTVAKGIGVSAEGSIGFCLDLGVDGSFADNYNLGLVASVGGGVVGGIMGAAVDVMLSLNAKPVKDLGGAYIGISGDIHAKFGASAAVDWDIGLENFTKPSLDHLIPSVSVAVGAGKGGKLGLMAGYSWVLVQRKN